MREILFKAKRVDNGEWVEGLLTSMWGQYHIINPNDENTAYPIDTDTICQYTGLTDKDGRKIWENDVVKYYFGDEVGIVKFGEYSSIFDSHKHIGFYVDWEQEYLRHDLGYWVHMEGTKIIGNIFDNVELLKEED